MLQSEPTPFDTVHDRGFPFSYGVFLAYYKTHDFKDASHGQLAVVGSLAGGLPDLLSIVLLPFLGRYPWMKQRCMFLGLALTVGGIVGAAFATKAWQVVVLQGLVTSVGAGE